MMRPLASLLLTLLLSLAGMAGASRAPIGELHAGWSERGGAAILEQSAPARLVVPRPAPTIAPSVQPGCAAAPSAGWHLAVPVVVAREAIRARVAPSSARRLAFPYDATAPPRQLA
jgi:hypothetical protein